MILNVHLVQEYKETLRTNLFMTNLTNEELTCLIELVEMEHLISLCEINTEFFCNLNLKLKHIRKNHDIKENQRLDSSYKLYTQKTKSSRS